MVLTTTTLTSIRSAAISNLNTNQTHIAVSTNSTTPTESDTSLGGTELVEAVFSSSTDANSVTKTMFIDGTEFNSNTITKAGLYDAISGGNLLSSSLTNSISKDSDTEVFVEIKTNVTVVNV